MKCATSFIAFLSTSGAIAAPSLTWKHQYTNSTTPYQNTNTPTNTSIPSNTTTPTKNTTTSIRYSGFVLPTLLKRHGSHSGDNIPSNETVTVRQGANGTSTMYEIPVPSNLSGKTCSLVLRAGRIGHGDTVMGTQAIDIFSNNYYGNGTSTDRYHGDRHNIQLARLHFNELTGLYDFDETVFPPAVESFPCPAGETLEWESVAVGEFDINIIQQDFKIGNSSIPNGLSIAYY